MRPIFGEGEPIRGYALLIAVMDHFPVYKFVWWWANPIYFVAIVASLLNHTRIAVVFAVVAALLAVSYELISLCDNRGAMESLLPGCLLWIASLQLLACHELWRQWLEWRRRLA